MRWIGEAGSSFFDVWSVVHLAFWLVVGSNVEAIAAAKQHEWKNVSLVVGVLVGAYAWEFVERFLFEPAGYVRFPEIWYNRWISDPLVGVLGAFLGALLVRGK